MERIPEPELMDDPAQARAYAGADFQEPHDAFVAQLAERLADLPTQGHAIDLGCGPGDVSMRFARRFPGWTLDAVDASAPMLELAEQALAGDPLARRIRFRLVHLPTANPFAPFDLVFSNSLLHHLGDPLDLWRTARSWGRPGAPIFVMDLMRPTSKAQVGEFVERYAAGEPEVLRRDFQHSLCAAYRPEELREQLAASGLEALRVEATSDRHLIVWGRLPH